MKEQVGLQLGHVKHIGDANSSSCASHFHSNNNGPHSDGFGHAIITQLQVVWRNYLIGVQCCLMQSYVLRGSCIHDPFAKAPQVRSVLRVYPPTQHHKWYPILTSFLHETKIPKDKLTRYIDMQFPSYMIIYNNTLDALTCMMPLHTICPNKARTNHFDTQINCLLR